MEPLDENPSSPDETPPRRGLLDVGRGVLGMLQRALIGNFFLKLVSFVIALILWAVVSEEPDVESSISVPVTLRLPSELVLTNTPTQSVMVYLKGSRSKLKTIPLGELDLSVDLQDAREGDSRYSFESSRVSNLPSGISVVGYSPAYLEVKLDRKRVRNLPIRFRKEGELPMGYRVVNTRIVPPAVTVEGPRAEVDALTELRTAPVDLSERTRSFDEEVRLQIESPYVRVQGTVEKVKVQVAIEQQRGAVRLDDVPVRLSDALEHYQLDPETVSLLLEFPRNQGDELRREDIRVHVELLSGEEPPTLPLLLRLNNTKEGVPVKMRVELPADAEILVKKMVPSVLELKPPPSDADKAADKKGKNRAPR